MSSIFQTKVYFVVASRSQILLPYYANTPVTCLHGTLQPWSGPANAIFTKIHIWDGYIKPVVYHSHYKFVAVKRLYDVVRNGLQARCRMFFVLFVCLGLTSLWNIWGHITTVPACSSGTLTNVLPHRNAMPQTQDTTPHPVTVYRHGADLSLCYPLMWNVTLERCRM